MDVKKLLSLLLALCLIFGACGFYTAFATEDEQEETESTQTEQETKQETEQEPSQEESSQESTVSVEVETSSKTTVTSKQSDSGTQNSYTRQPDVGGTTGTEFGDSQNGGTVTLNSSDVSSAAVTEQKNIFNLKDLFLKLMIVTVLLIIGSIAALIYVNRPSFAGKKPKKGAKSGDNSNEISSGKKRRGSPRRRGKHDRRR